MEESRGSHASCASCGATVDGRYCSRCGEKRLDGRELTVQHFVVHTLAPELLSVDSKIWRTLRALLFRPAWLTLEYVAGRRRLYVQPLRILILAVVVYALATQGGLTLAFKIGAVRLSLAPAGIPAARSVEDTLDQIDRNGILERMFRNRVGPVETVPEDVRNRFNSALRSSVTPLSFATVVLLALVLFACFHRRRALLVEHAIFSMHYFSFVLLWSLIAVAAIRMHVMSTVLGIAVLLLVIYVWQFAYLTIALRRVYWLNEPSRVLPWVLAGALSVFVYLINSAFITGVQLVGGAIAIWRL